MNLEDMRRSYQRGSLEIHDLDPIPYLQLKAWLHQAQEDGVVEPNAMVLATANAQRIPSARTVLLKKLDSLGLVWFSNYESRKGQELSANPWAAVCFSWPEIERQVIVRGKVERLDDEANDRYWRRRPREHQLGSAASPQSQIVHSREELEERWKALEDTYPGSIPCPPQWGGYRLVPESWEFWQGRVGRLHDRFGYSLDGRAWKIDRLAP